MTVRAREPLALIVEREGPARDSILGGGFPATSINVLMGEPGSGKTILAERLIFANAGDRPILYLTTLSEPLDKIVRYLQQFSFFDEGRLGSSIIYDSIGDALVQKGVATLVPRVKEAITGDKPKIIVIDSFKAIHDLGAPLPEMRKMLFELAGLITAHETTAFLVGEYSPGEAARYPEFAIADGIVELARNENVDARRALPARAQAARVELPRGVPRLSHLAPGARGVPAAREPQDSTFLSDAGRAAAHRRPGARQGPRGRLAARAFDVPRGADGLRQDDPRDAVS